MELHNELSILRINTQIRIPRALHNRLRIYIKQRPRNTTLRPNKRFVRNTCRQPIIRILRTLNRDIRASL